MVSIFFAFLAGALAGGIVSEVMNWQARKNKRDDRLLSEDDDLFFPPTPPTPTGTVASEMVHASRGYREPQAAGVAPAPAPDLSAYKPDYPPRKSAVLDRKLTDTHLDGRQARQRRQIEAIPLVGALYNRREEVSRGPFSHAEMNLHVVNARIREENEDHKILVLQVKGDQVLYCLVFARNNFVRRENARHMHCSVETFDAQFVMHSNFPANKTHTPEA